MSSTTYYKSRYFPTSRGTSVSRLPSPSPAEQYSDLTNRYQELTDKYEHLKEKYRAVSTSKWSPWSRADSTDRLRSPTPAVPVRRAASREPESSYVRRTPPPPSQEEYEPLTSDAIIKKYRSPLVERQIEAETPRYKNPSLLDRELEILVPRYRVLEARRKAEMTPPKRTGYQAPAQINSAEAAAEAAEAAPAAEEALGLPPTPPPYYPRAPANKYSLTYQHHPVNKRRTHAGVPQYETFEPVRNGVTPTSRTVCTARELSAIITEPSGGVYVLPNEPFNEVYPDVFIGDMHTALCTQQLRALGVTHVLNASQKDPRPGVQEPGYYVNTTSQYYRRADIEFLGVPATDSLSFDLSQYFEQAAAFIDSALRIGGRVLVHCHQGISRSATLVLAFLMLRRGMTAQDATRTVRSKRQIIPNESFLRQLCELNSRLMSERRNYYRK